MWKLPAAPTNEVERLKVLVACNIMDTSRDERFDRLTRLATRFYDADVAFIGLVDADFQWMKSVTSEEIAPQIERRLSVCNMIIESGQPLVVGDLKTDPRLAGHPVVPHLSLRFYAGVPLVVRPDLAIGSMCIMRRDPANQDTFDIEPLQELAAIAIDEVELWKLTQDLKRKSETDGLTGLANRRSFDEALGRSVRRANRTGLPLSLLLVDVDRFKLLNDMSGHPAGDAVLRRLGAILSATVSRPYDVAARYGGEEFAVILPDTDTDGARAIGEAIRGSLAEAGIFHPAGGLLSVSVGVATRGGSELGEAGLVSQADTALYAAKRAGRDRVMCWGEELAAG